MSGPWPPGDARVVGQADLTRGEPPLVSQHRRQDALLTLGRIIYGGYFLYNGVNHFLNRSMLAGYAKSKNVPWPDAAVIGSGALLVGGGLSILAGFRPKLGAALVTTFLAGVSAKMHDFSAVEDQQQRAQELVNFSKNMALIGGAALAASVPEPWPLSPAKLGSY
jgi:uncharacterized membrane protein YphA (DoxX/SURF4 family)